MNYDKPGIYKNLSQETYNNINALNNSKLWQANKSPAHFKLALDGKISINNTKALDFGTALHAALLYGDDFLDHVSILNRKYDRRNAQDKAEYDAIKFFADKKNKVLISKQDSKNIKKIIDNIKLNSFANNLLFKKISDSSENELTIVWNDSFLPILKKGRIDRLLLFPNKAVITDIKSTADASETQKSIEKYGYANQAVHYIEGIKEIYNIEEVYFFFIFIDKETFKPLVVELDEEYLKCSYNRYRELIEISYKCIQTNNFPLQLEENKPLIIKAPKHLIYRYKSK